MEETSKDLICSRFERTITRLPISYFSFAYILFVVLLSIFIFFDWEVDWIDLSDSYQLLGAFFASLIVPFEILAIKLVLDGARERFYYLDIFFNRYQTKFKESIRLNVINKKINYLLFLFFVGIPLFFCKFDGFPYYNINNENIIYLCLDIYRNILLIISIYLLCILFWHLINIYFSFNMESKKLRELLPAYNLAILRRKIAPVRYYFLFALIIFMSSISILNASLIVETIDEVDENNAQYEAEEASQPDLSFARAFQIGINFVSAFQKGIGFIFMGMFLFFGLVLTLMSLKIAQNIIDNAIIDRMDQIEETIRACLSKIDQLVENESEEDGKQSENLKKILELQQQEWEEITREKTGLNLKESSKEAGAFVVSIIIPVISFLITTKSP